MTTTAGSLDKSNLQIKLETALPYVFFVLIGYAVADISSLVIRDLMIPQKAPPTKPSRGDSIQAPNKGAYQTIIARNIFSADGVIPEPLSAKGSQGRPGDEAPPVPSQLPLTLVGTIVHSIPAKSIANIELKGKNQVIAYTINRDIDKVATLVKVERNKAIFRNNNLGRLEFIEIKSLNKLSLGTGVKPAGPLKTGTEVKEIAPNRYEISRSSILRHTQDLSSLLMQASTIPRKKPNGDIDCFILTSFNPDSVFAELSVQQGDCIKTVNGEPIDSPAKAMELFNVLKNSNNIKLTVERDGRDVEKEFSIK